jgi:hypothetical protein
VLTLLGPSLLRGEGVMSQFSAVETATEGFRLMRRRPGTTAAWVLAWLVLAFGPMIAMLAMVMPHLTELLSTLKDMPAGGPDAVGRMSQFHMAFLSMIGPWLLWLMVAQTILHAAIFRTVLEPKNSALASLRLGMDEVRLFLLHILLFVLWIVFMALIVGGCAAVFAAAYQAPNGTAPWIDAAAMLLAIALVIYVPVRLSLAAPMTFALKRIEVFGSWRKTRGRFWSLIGMMLVIIVFILVISMVTGGIQKVMFAVLGDWNQIASLQNLGSDPRVIIPAALHAVGPGLLAVLVIQAIADVLIRIAWLAPFAAAYRDFSGSRASETPAGVIAAHA